MATRPGKHGTTKKTPLELHAEELPHLLSSPSLAFDTARVAYRIVDTDGTVQYANNRYSVPWRLVGERVIMKNRCSVCGNASRS